MSDASGAALFPPSEWAYDPRGPSSQLRALRVDHRGTVFTAPENDMGRGLIQFTLSATNPGAPQAFARGHWRERAERGVLMRTHETVAAEVLWRLA